MTHRGLVVAECADEVVVLLEEGGVLVNLSPAVDVLLEAVE